MKTIKELINELQKFPPDAKCFAYEGESTGISIFMDGRDGFIYCSPKETADPPTEEFYKPKESLIVKTIIPIRDEYGIEFNEEEMKALGIDANDKFEVKIDNDTVVLEKYGKIDIELSELSRPILESLIKESCESGLSVEDIVAKRLTERLDAQKDN